MLKTIGERYGVPLRADLRDRRFATRPAGGCRRRLRAASVRTGKGALLDDAALRALKKAVPHVVVHADLAAFAQQLIQRERHARGESDEADSVFIPIER
jgi:hypothetical protein